MPVLRTPEVRFDRLPGFAYEPRCAAIEGLRMAWVEAGRGDPIVLLHGEPVWGYVWRRVIPGLAAAGRVLAPDLIGCGRSDKPAEASAYSLRAHLRWLRGWLDALALERVTLVGFDTGGMLALRLLADTPDRFTRIALVNTALPDGRDPGELFLGYLRFMQTTPFVDVPGFLRQALVRAVPQLELEAYGAPFPDASYQIGLRALERLRGLALPVLMPWSDPVEGSEPWRERLREVFPQARLVPFEDAGHYLPEDDGEALASELRHFVAL